MEALSPWHLVIVAVVAAVLFFGWRQLPDMTRSLGRSLRIFKTELKGMTEDTQREVGHLAEAVNAQPATAQPVSGQPVTAGPAPATAAAAAATVRPLPIRRSDAG